MKEKPAPSIVTAKHLLPLTAEDLKGIVGTDCLFFGVDPKDSFSWIAVADNMSIRRGCLYIPFYEDDQYCVSTISYGAAAVMTDHLIPDIPCIVVKDPVEAVRRLCCFFYAAIQLPSVVVAGSEGKTTTKRMVKRVLQTQYRVFSQDGNYNTLQALCCSLQAVLVTDEIIVQEVDEKRINSTVNCSQILKPEIALVTNIADAHLGFYKSREALTASITGITAGLQPNGCVIINADDVGSMRAHFDSSVLTVGINNENADCKATNIVEGKNGTKFIIRYLEETVHVKIPLHGEHNVYNALMAFLVGKIKGVPTRRIKKGLSLYRNTGIRQNIVRKGHTIVYADCVNASSKSIEYAIKAFCSISDIKGKKIAVLGDIAEIEGFEKETYSRIAACVDSSSIDVIITCGKASEMILSEIHRDIVKIHTNDKNELNSVLQQYKKEKNNGYLFKASRFMRLEDSISAVFPEHYKDMQ